MSTDDQAAARAVDPAANQQRRLGAGAKMPAIGLGTFGSDSVTPTEVAAAVRGAAAIGYRHFDCASVYGNEDAVGAALEAIIRGGIKREEIWVTSKLWNDKHGENDVIASCRKSLADLRPTISTCISCTGRFRTSIRPAATSLRAVPMPSPTFMRLT